MAKSNERCDKNGRVEYESEELQRLCRNEKDDDDETFHSLDSESNADETKSQDETSFEGEPFREEACANVKLQQSSSSNADDVSNNQSNQCIDENSASYTTKINQEDHNTDISISDETKFNCSSEQIVVNNRHENSSECASGFSDTGSRPTRIPYRRNAQDNRQLIQVTHYARAANERAFERSISCTDECPFHSEEIIKYVCLSCNKLACQACCTIVHKHCHAPEYIPTLISKPEFQFEEKCKLFEEDLTEMQNRLKLNKGMALSNLRVCELMKINAKAQFKKQREELDRMFDCMERDLNRKISEIENNGVEKIKELLTKQEKIENELQENMHDYNQRKEEGNTSRIFTKIEMSKEIIDDIKADLTSIEKDNRVDRYVFTPSKDVLDFKQKVLDLGTIQTVNSETKSTITNVKTIGMKRETDQSSCQISGLALLSMRHLLAVDFANSAIKVVDIFNITDVIRVPVTPAPFDITVINDTQGNTSYADAVNGQVILTLPKENLLRFMDYTLPSTFTAKRDIQTNGMCRAVLYNAGKLFVTFPNQGKIEILDIDGSLLNRVTTETIGRLFHPLSITLDTAEGKLFVSDKDNHAVFCMSTDGDVITVFNDHDLIEPRGLCVNNTGSVFVCSFATHKIYHLSSTCQLISTMKVADKESPAPFPYSIAYSDENNEIYVGQFAKDCVKVYTLAAEVISS